MAAIMAITFDVHLTVVVLVVLCKTFDILYV